jgi:hypothetical protein
MRLCHLKIVGGEIDKRETKKHRKIERTGSTKEAAFGAAIFGSSAGMLGGVTSNAIKGKKDSCNDPCETH